MYSEKTKNGKVKFVEYYKDPYTGKRRRATVLLDRDTPQSRKKAAAIIQEKINKKLNERETDNATFGEVYKLFYAEWSASVKEQSIISLRVIDKKVLELIGEDTLVKNVDRRLIQSGIQELFNEDHATNYLKEFKWRVGQILRYAVRFEYIDKDETKFVTVPTKPETIEEIEKKKFNFLTTEEVSEMVELLTAKGKYDYAEMVTVLYLTGMRYGELTGLTLDNIDLGGQNITINGTDNITLRKKTTPKTKKSVRTISVSDTVSDAIKNKLTRNAEQFENVPEFLFVSKNGIPRSVSTFNETLQRNIDELNLKQHVTSHIFRHSHISLLAELGMSLKQIMDRVGHADSKTTIEIYMHVTKNLEEKMLRKLNEIKL